ncbi:MAG: hypothetical protein ACREBD_31705 [Blastocatellia bacterium]
MVTDMATTIDPNSREAALDVEYPIQLAYTREPVMCLAGTVSVISPGRRDLALSDVEWQDLELLELSELQEQPDLPESPESPESEDVADGE